MRVRFAFILASAYLGAVSSRSVIAQEVDRSATADTSAPSQSLASIRSVFASADRKAWVPAAAAAAVAPMQRPIALDLHRASLSDALDVVAKSAGLLIGYSEDVAKATARVSIHVDGMPIGEALGYVLQGTPFMAYVSIDGRQLLVRRPFRPKSPLRSAQATGTITGQVTDARSGQPLPNAAVVIGASPLRVTTRSGGQYVITGVPAGIHQVTARLLGHVPLTKVVTVSPDSVAHADFSLSESAAALEQVVTTAIGDQRRIELGNAIGTIQADSIAPTAPIAALTDLLSGRVPSVQVLPSSGMVGSATRIRIRGLSSVSLSNDPVVYIDGARMDAGTGGANAATAPNGIGAHPAPSRLNDIDPDEIESIDVLKGPAAATEYGTDAANGVIVIKTKRGRAGVPQWSASVEQGLTTIPTDRFLVPYHSWGHTTDGTHQPVPCPIVSIFGEPALSAGTCAVDSLTHFSPLSQPATTFLRPGPSGRYDLQVSGGTSQVQYFFGGAYTNQVGPLHLPPAEQAARVASGLPVPGYAERPNDMDQTSLRARVGVGLGRTTDLSASAAYVGNLQRAPSEDLAVLGATTGFGYRDTLNGYGAFGLPRQVFAHTASEGVHRFTTSGTGTWRPADWLTGHVTGGLDVGSQTDVDYAPPGPDHSFETAGTGYRGVAQMNTTLTTVDVGATARAALRTTMSSNTSAGLQYNDRRSSGSFVYASGLSPGSGNLNGATQVAGSELGGEAITLGAYGEEMLGWNDRLFVTGAVRVDAGSGFGKDAHSAIYPKASVSWAAIQQRSLSIRLRAAYGESGVQPPSGARLTLFGPSAIKVAGGVVSTGDTLQTLGNPRLRPERTGEWESGIDATALGGRLTMELTLYTKTSHDAIITRTLPASVFGGGMQQENLGSVRNRGVEGGITYRVLESRMLAWDLGVTASANQNRLLTLGKDVPPLIPDFFYQQRPGYPIFSNWGYQLRYADANHDGIIEKSEVSVADSVSFLGPSTPTREASVNTGIGLFNNLVRLTGLVDYRGGNTILLNAFLLRPYNDPTTPLKLQARNVAIFAGNQPNSGEFEPGWFVRLRELGITLTPPNRWMRTFRARSTSLTLSCRNVALWTRFTGMDPEVNSAFVNLGAADAVIDNGLLPQARVWLARINLGY